MQTTDEMITQENVVYNQFHQRTIYKKSMRDVSYLK
jgi:hypothetical protein